MAVFPPASVIEPLRAVLPAGARLTRAAKWHITLVFLGEAEPSAVSAALAGVTPPPPFRLRLTGAGRFGSAAWAGVAGDLASLGALSDRVREALTSAGFAFDGRPLHPHLTVSYHSDRAIQRALAGFSGPEWTVCEFALVSSLNQEYAQVAAWPMKAG